MKIPKVIVCDGLPDNTVMLVTDQQVAMWCGGEIVVADRNPITGRISIPDRGTATAEAGTGDAGLATTPNPDPPIPGFSGADGFREDLEHERRTDERINREIGAQNEIVIDPRGGRQIVERDAAAREILWPDRGALGGMRRRILRDSGSRDGFGRRLFVLDDEAGAA